MHGHNDIIQDMVNLPNGLLASASDDKSIKIWNLTDSSSRTFYINKGKILSMNILKNGNLVSGDSQGNVLVHNLTDGSFYTIHSLSSGANIVPFPLIGIFYCYYSEPVSRFAQSLIILFDGSLALASNHEFISSYNSYGSCPICYKFTGLYYIPIFKYDSSTKNISAVVNSELSYGPIYATCSDLVASNFVFTIIQLPNGSIASGGADKAIRIWDINTKKNINKLIGHTSSVISLALLPNGLLVSGSSDSTIKVWDYSTSSLLQTLNGHTGFFYLVKS